MEQLQGKVAVVTGGASGIGNALATRFAAEGMKVAIADIEPNALAKAAEALRADGAEVHSVVCDVSNGDDVDRLGDEVIDAFGAVHVVCNNAGVSGGGMIKDASVKDWDWVLGVNLWGVIHGVRVFLPKLLEQGEGHIVNTGSVLGLFSSPFAGPYSASKFGVVALSETLFHELKMTASPVGVSVLCPGWVATNLHDAERNRPDELRNESGSDDDPVTAVMRETLKGVMANGMAPADVAGKVLAAIKAKRFYILTHGTMTHETVRARMEAIIAGDDPVPWTLPQ